MSDGDTNIEPGPVARGYRFGSHEHGHLAQNMSSVTTGGRGSPHLHGFFVRC